MKTVDFIIGREWEILAYYGHHRTDLKHIDCPICERKKKFRLNEYEGKPMYICTCGSGDLFKLVQETTGKDFKTIAQEIDETFGNSFEARQEKPIINNRLSTAVQQFRDALPLSGTQAEQYFNSRGISIMPRGGVKFAEYIPNSELKMGMPALIAIASNEYSEAIQRHITYLDGDKKAILESPRKMLSLQEYSGSIAVKLFQPKSTLGIAEGIETALSAHQLYRLPVWSTLNATLMKKFKAPTGVDTLIIYADNDLNGTGLSAAFECANKNLLANNQVNKVIVKWPEKPDFNDMLVDGGESFEWRLSNKVKK